MSQRIANEIENRRGLALGLTLAELLLLLLFILLLALGWRQSTLQKEVDTERNRAERAEATLDSLSPLISELKKKAGIDDTTAKELVAKLGQIESPQKRSGRVARLTVKTDDRKCGIESYHDRQ